MNIRPISPLLACAAAWAVALSPVPALRAGPPAVEPDPPVHMDAVRSLVLPDTEILSAEVDPADGSCRVVAVVSQPPSGEKLRVWVALPVHGWNGNFHGTGGGGYATGFERCLIEPLARGYAVAATDGGNPEGSARHMLAEGRRPNWQAIRNNGYLATHEMTVVGKAVAEAFYGRPIRHSYFIGGSSGGRQALTEAQRYPDDYDGVVAISPAIYRERYVLQQLWAQAVMRDAGDFIAKAKLEAVTAAVVAACDRDDGVADGVIDDPVGCRFDPRSLVGRVLGGSVFTGNDAEVVRQIWEGPRGVGGRFLWFGPTRGSSLTVVAGTRGSPLEGDPMGEGLDWVRYYLLRDPAWDGRDLTRAGFELLFNQSVEEFGAIVGGGDPDLRAFRDHGGRLIIYHGLSDDIVPPGATIAYYRSVEEHMGGAAATEAFARLFLVPGGNHGFTLRAPFPGGREIYRAIERWVEDGVAPESVRAELRDPSGKLIRSRPIFAFPRVARYSGSGSTDDAANFVSQSLQ